MFFWWDGLIHGIGLIIFIFPWISDNWQLNCKLRVMGLDQEDIEYVFFFPLILDFNWTIYLLSPFLGNMKLFSSFMLIVKFRHSSNVTLFIETAWPMLNISLIKRSLQLLSSLQQINSSLFPSSWRYTEYKASFLLYINSRNYAIGFVTFKVFGTWTVCNCLVL